MILHFSPPKPKGYEADLAIVKAYLRTARSGVGDVALRLSVESSEAPDRIDERNLARGEREYCFASGPSVTIDVRTRQVRGFVSGARGDDRVYGADGRPIPRRVDDATAGGTATAGSTTTTATASTSTTGATATTSTASTAGTSATSASAGATGTSPDPQPLPNPDPTTGTTSTTGATGATGASTGGTNGGSTGGGGGWDPSKSGPKLDDGTTDNGYVSGTDVNVTFTFSIKRTGDSPYTGVYVKSADLAVGGEADSGWNVPINQSLTADANGDYVWPVKVRFASTRFNDAATIALNAKFYYQLNNPSGAYLNQDCTLPTLHVVAYNKGLAWETKQVYNDDGQYQTVIPPVQPQYNWDSPRAIDDAGGAVAQLGAMNHAVPLGTVLKGADILGGLKHSTAVLAYTHGNADESFLTSWGDYNDSNGSYDYRALSFGTGSSSEVWQAVQSNRVDSATGRRIPPINLAVLHACNLSAGGHQLARALGIYGPNEYSSNNDRACAGFPQVVYSKLYDSTTNALSSTHYLSEHAQAIYADLAKGLTIDQCLNDAYDTQHLTPAYYDQLAQAYRPMGMNVKGDHYMRLISIYTGDTATKDGSPANPDYPLHSSYPYIWRKVTQ